MDTAQWPQEIGLVKPMEEIVPNACPSRTVLERSRTRPQKEQALNCPRCNSTNTKFCYYNNYSLTQPRYFCKTCRRYWTEGGSLRNVPVGGGSRKNKRSSSSSSLSSSSLSIASGTATATSGSITTSNTLLSSKIKLDPDHLQNPKINEGQDLNLGFPASAQDYPRIPAEFIELPTIENRSNNSNSSSSSSSSTTTTTVSALDLLRSTTTGITSTGIGLSSFMPMPLTVPLPDINAVYSSSGFGNLQDFKQQAGLNFVGGVDDGLGSSGTGYGGVQLGSGSNGRLLIPFEELKPSTNDHQYDQNIRGQAAEATGYWSGMLGGTGSW